MSSNEEYLDNLLKSVTGDNSVEGNLSSQRQGLGEVKLPSMSELFNMEQEPAAAANFGINNNILSDDTNLFDDSVPAKDEPISYEPMSNKGLSDGINPLDIPESFEELEKYVNEEISSGSVFNLDMNNQGIESVYSNGSSDSFAINEDVEHSIVNNNIEPDYINDNNDPVFTDEGIENSNINDSNNLADEIQNPAETMLGETVNNEAGSKTTEYNEAGSDTTEYNETGSEITDNDETGYDDLDALLNSIDEMGDSVSGALDNSETRSVSDEDETDITVKELEADKMDITDEADEAVTLDVIGEMDVHSNEDAYGQEELSTVIPEDVDLDNLDSILASFDEDDNDASSTDEKEISDAELNDILSSSENDGELSEIGELLEKNDSQEAVDASLYDSEDDNTGDMESLLGNYDNDLPNDSNVNETQEDKKERKKREKEEKKKAKKEAKEKRKNKNKDKDSSDDNEDYSEGDKSGGNPSDSENFRIPDDINDIEELEGTLGSLGFMDNISDDAVSEDNNFKEHKDKKNKTKDKAEKKGFLSKILDAFSEEIDDDTDELAQKAGMTAFAEETAKDIAQTGAADNEMILNSLDEDELAKGKGNKKKAKKKDKKKDKKKEKKPKKTKAPKEKKVDNSPVVRVSLKKIAAVMLCCISLGVLICVAAIFIPYSMDMKSAITAYDNAEYEQAFMDLTGHKLNEEEQELYNKTVILYRLDRKYESYENYMNLGMRTEALNALVQGVGAIDESREAAYNYGITSQFELLAQKITDALSSTFAVSIDRAREWLMIDDSKEYTKTLDNYASGNDNTVSGEMMENPVIKGEEEELSYDSGN